jgi:hypothetical protein
MKPLRLAALVLPLALVAACTSVPMATPQEDQLGKQFREPPPDKAALYLYRTGLLGALAPVNVQVATPGGGLDLALNRDYWARLDGYSCRL